MVLAMGVGLWVTMKRYTARGGEKDVVYDVAIWAIPFGLVGARLYHVITTPASYADDPLAILRVWEGGMAIWGGVGGGAIGAFIALRRLGQRVGPLADSLAPGLLLAQAFGRFGNYFNQELFGSPTDLPWGLHIDDAHLPSGYASGTLFHPTFLYESLWNVSMALLLIYLGTKVRFKAGQVFALYMVVYPLGRIWMETMRLDEAKVFFGLRLNAWTSILVMLAGIAIFVIAGKRGASENVGPQEREEYRQIVAAREKKQDPLDPGVAGASDENIGNSGVDESTLENPLLDQDQ